ncbi:MAG: hypothetical protein ABIJ09_03510 [Pseudomonadota bacterium]
MRTWTKFVMGALAALTMAACAELNPDINRVQPPYEAKAIFDGSWYFRRTVIDAAPGNQWVSQGDGDWAVIERIRWKITQGFLYGYRDWEYVPGSETGEYDGSDYFGSPVVMYAIKEQFDIRRSYNPQTGEETNVIDKNVERPWNEREYIVVDWSQNLAPTLGLINWYFAVPVSAVTSNAYYVQAHEIDNPDRARVTADNIDIVGKYTVWPDILGCNYMYDAPDCAPGELHVRHSFVKLDPDHDYQPMAYPDSVDLVDAAGAYVRDGNGQAVRIPIFERFGDYRLDRLTYDRDYDVTESGVMRRSNRFNLWKKSFDDRGQPIPYHLREPQPVVYYLNVEFPDDDSMPADLRELYNMKKASYGMGDWWNEPFRETVAMLRVMSRNGTETATRAEIDAELASGGVPEKMFEVRDNSCNIDNLKRYVADHPDLEDALQDHIGGIAMLDKQNLPRACTVVESLTEGQDDAFTWQRHGDLRYNMVIWVPKHMEAGWLGLGPMFMDPITGETVSSTAHIAGALLDTAVTRVLDYVDALNGQIDPFDVITGQDVNRHIREVQASLHREARAGASDRAIEDMNRRFRQLGEGRDNLLKEISPSYAKSRLALAKDTPIEDLVTGHDDWLLAEAAANTQMGQNIDASSMMELASPAREFRREMPARREARNRELMSRCRDYPPEFFDTALLHTALMIKDRPRAEKYAILRYVYYKAVITHEVGHNIGMRHNFAGSADPLNYVKGFWEIQMLPENLQAAKTQLTAAGDNRAAQVDACITEQELHPETLIDTQDCLGANEMKYSSIMDYTHYNPLGDIAGLGMYDSAFVYFVYGGILEAFDDGAIDPTVLGNKTIKQWIWEHDYKQIPTLFHNDIDNIYKRHYVKYSWGPSQTTLPEPAFTVPYKVCYDERANREPDCRLFDYGANQTEVMETELNRYHQYYYFTHFNRGRTNYYWYWNAMDVSWNILSRVLQTFQYMYYFRAQDPTFFEKGVGQDYLTASLMGINLFSEVLGTPPNGNFLELDSTGGMLVSSMRDGYWVVEPSSEWLGGTTTNLPSAGGSGVMVEKGFFNECDQTPSTNYMNIPLGAGRPFFLGYSSDYEEWLFTYVGSYFDKDTAIYLLAYPQATFLPFYYTSGVGQYDPRTYSINFFRLFRKEVLNTFYGVVSGDLSRFAPVFRRDPSTNDWNFEPRKLVDLSGELPDYTPGGDVKLVQPSMAYNIPYSALLYGMALMNNLLDGEEDFAHGVKIAVKGQEDDIADFDRVAMYDGNGVKQKAEFVHPLTGVTYRALRYGESPIGFHMVEEANRRLARWREFQTCVDEPDNNSGLCECTYQSQAEADGRYVCPDRETMGCIMQDRTLRSQTAMELVERQVELMNNLRLFHNVFQYNL